MTGPEQRSEDLNTSVPPGWGLSGFSTPRPEGDTHYRVPLARQTVLTFPTETTSYAQYRYQIHPPVTPVTGRVFLNGRLLDTYTFPKGKYTNREVGAFTRPGQNKLTIEYLCGSAPCAVGDVKQFWTRLVLSSPLREQARTAAGLGVERWWLDAPHSRLTIRGAEPLISDGINYYHRIESGGFTLGWPEGIKVLDAAFEINATGPFRVTTRVNDQVVSVKRGDRETGVRPAVSLVAFPQASHIDVKIDCLSGTRGCAYLYFTRITVLSGSAPALSWSGWVLAGGALLLLTTALWWWLSLPSLVRKSSA